MSFHRFGPVPALLLLTSILHAGPAVVVTLSSVTDRVRAQNPELAAARLRIHEAVARASQAGKLPNPELETAFEHNPSFGEGRFEIGFNQKFPITGKLRLEREFSATAIQSAEAEVREVERRIASDARHVVVRILAVRERRELLKQQIEVAGQFAGFLSESAARGEGSVIDAGQAKLEASSLALELKRIDADETSLVGGLKPLLGMSPSESLVVGGKLPSPRFSSRSPDPEKRPDYQIARLEVQAADRQFALEQSRRREDLEGGVFAGVERTEDLPKGYENEAIIGLRLKIPLPWWNKNEGAIREADLKRRRKEMEAESLGRNIRLEAAAALAEMKQWERMIREIDDQLLPLVEEQSDLAESAYREGQGEIQSVLRCRERRLEAKVSKLDAQREFQLARERYQAALGEP